MAAIRVMLVEDHQLVREGLRRMLELEPDIQIVAEAGSAEEALPLALSLTPEVILMDIKLPDMDGIELTRRLQKAVPQCNVIVLTLYEEYLPHAVEAGAAGYLLKDLRREELVKAIKGVRQGRSPLSLSLRRDQLADIVSGQGVTSRYSERELAILRLVANGVSTKDMAQQLFLSEATVKRALRSVYDKLGARSRSEAVAKAIKHHLI